MRQFGRGEHRGSMSLKNVSLPSAISENINEMLRAKQGLLKTIKSEATKMNSFLKSRSPPRLNQNQAAYETGKWKEAVMAKLEDLSSDLTPQQLDLYRSEIIQESRRRKQEMKQLSGFWKAISYDSLNACLAYTLCRAAPNYAVAVRVLNEIYSRDNQFKPEAVLDFGSGCGSLVWALLSLWPQETRFFYLNDVSDEFNKLSCSILAGDDVDFSPAANGIYYKMHLPANVSPNFDLTFASYALSELNGGRSRMAAIKHLLKCTRKYIVFVENGNLRSHHILEEIREFISTKYTNQFEIFAPCPHLKPCPLLMLNLRNNKKHLVCKTQVKYQPIIIRNHPTPEVETEAFTYLILRKKDLNSVDESFNGESKWPRVVLPPKVGSKHVTLRLCFPDGSAGETVVTKQQPWFFYRSCRNINLGDRLPFCGFSDSVDSMQYENYEESPDMLATDELSEAGDFVEPDSRD